MSVTVPIKDYWPGKCCLCELPTNNPDSFTIFSGAGYSVNLVFLASARYTTFLKHPCRICENCKASFDQKQMKFIYIPAIVLGLVMILTYIIAIIRKEMEFKFQEFCAAFFVPIVIGWLLEFTIGRAWDYEKKAMKKIEEIRSSEGGSFACWTESKFNQMMSTHGEVKKQ